jgi:HAD superfamily hydrolase (TIGR01509 family)
VVDAVVFDLDGVLIDSEPVWEQVRRAYVAEHGGTWLPDSQSRLMGMSTPEWAGYLSDDLGVGLQPDRIAADVVQRMAKAYEEDLPLMPGAVAAVERMGGRWPLGLASSSPRLLIDRVLTGAGLDAVFRVTVSTEEVGRGKPAPDVYLTVAAGLGVPPTKCAAIEDSSNGVRSAHTAGAMVVAIPHPRYPLASDARAAVWLLLDDLSDLTEQVLLGGTPTGRSRF